MTEIGPVADSLLLAIDLPPDFTPILMSFSMKVVQTSWLAWFSEDQTFKRLKGAKAGAKTHVSVQSSKLLSGAVASPVNLTFRNLWKFLFRDPSCPL